MILPGGRDEQPPATAATRRQDTLLRKKPASFAQRFKRGTKLTIKWAEGEYYNVIVTSQGSPKGRVNVTFEDDGIRRRLNLYGTDTQQCPRMVEGRDNTFT